MPGSSLNVARAVGRVQRRGVSSGESGAFDGVFDGRYSGWLAFGARRDPWKRTCPNRERSAFRCFPGRAGAESGGRWHRVLHRCRPGLHGGAYLPAKAGGDVRPGVGDVREGDGRGGRRRPVDGLPLGDRPVGDAVASGVGLPHPGRTVGPVLREPECAVLAADRRPGGDRARGVSEPCWWPAP